MTACTCIDYAEVYEPCGCLACAEQARSASGCPHRLDQILDGAVSNDRLYDGMCDRCFEEARDIRDCGQRVAEHVP